MSTILVVDDESMIRETLRDFLEFEGHKVLEAEDALAARSLLAQNKIDLAFLDVAMPGESGPELCARLKEDPDCKHIKVVILTGLDDEQHWREGLRSGADLYAVKPFGIERIRLIVQQLLGKDEA
ncbi:MAG TPA: response regulator [Holophagaceae bacterium]|nr:response regulator [Holophagaceae bacterium]